MAKILVFASGAAICWVAAVWLCISSLIPDACWPNLQMLLFVGGVALVELVLAVVVWKVLGWAIGKHHVPRLISSVIVTYFLTGVVVRASFDALLALEKQIDRSVPGIQCFANLMPNYVNAYVQTFWYLVLMGSVAGWFATWIPTRPIRGGDQTKLLDK